MNENYLSELELLLSKNENYVIEGKVNKNKVAELAHKYDAELVDLLADNKAMRRLFFIETKKDVLVFNKDKFIQFISNKEFLPDSYTSYKNKIGLGTGTDLLSENKEVVLNWPYKDCVLEGGQDKEDAKRAEVFFNEVLAPDQIDRLLDEKVLAGWKRYDKDGEHEVKEISDDDNLLIQGNNLLALHSLKKRYAGKVQLIYIDPPFNTEHDSFKYNDRFTHSTWLTFMKSRLEVARTLLSETGLIYIHIDHNEAHYLKVLCDEVFGRKNFINEVIWGYRIQGISKNAWPKKHDNIFIYGKTDKYKFKSEKEKIKYEKPFIDTQVVEPDLSTVSDSDKQKIIDALKANKPLPDKYKDKLFNSYFSEVYVRDVWDHDSTKPLISGANEFRDFRTQKPEGLIRRIIDSSTDEGDLILDFFSGSGTTAAVAHKMGRRYIAAEQMISQVDIIRKRLGDVIDGEQEGISKDINWSGGGNFVYAHLMDLGSKFVQKVKNASTDKELTDLLEQAKKSSFLSYKVDPEKINPGDKDFASLSIAHKKQLLLEIVDHNHLYINYTEIDDADYGVSAEDKKLNTQFYGN